MHQTATTTIVTILELPSAVAAVVAAASVTIYLMATTTNPFPTSSATNPVWACERHSIRSTVGREQRASIPDSIPAIRRLLFPATRPSSPNSRDRRSVMFLLFRLHFHPSIIPILASAVPPSITTTPALIRSRRPSSCRNLIP